MFIVYGAGVTGKNALNFLGWGRVLCFASSYGAQEDVLEKKVISYEDMLAAAKNKNAIIVVASARYNVEMVKRLEKDGVTKFFMFHEADPFEMQSVMPHYWLYRKLECVSYTRILSLNHVNKYKRIVIYGENFFLPYLISEIAIQSGYDKIVGVVPTSKKESVSTVGLPLVSLDDIWDKIDCLIVNKRRSETDIFDVMREKEPSFDVVHIYDVEKFVPEFHHPELKRFKNIHKGKRCFVVGNGPSLRVEDLDKLHEHGEICFGFNRICRVYDKTEWRPTYFCAGDPRVINIMEDDIPGIKGNVFLSDAYHSHKNPIFNNANYVHLNYEYYGNMHPDFSMDITMEVRLGNTTVYDIGLQFAVYMGFSEIYLIGCDCANFGECTDKDNHFISNYIDENERDVFKGVVTDWRSIFKAYETAKWYSRKNGFRIFNATRGGKLEIFERVDFDSLF